MDDYLPQSMATAALRARCIALHAKLTEQGIYVGLLTVTDTIAPGAADGTAGVVRLDADQAANQLFIGGAMKRAGTYGGPSSTASTRLACFSGTGVLTVLHGGGTMLIFR